jgi:hypothetical protein
MEESAGTPSIILFEFAQKVLRRTQVTQPHTIITLKTDQSATLGLACLPRLLDGAVGANA